MREAVSPDGNVTARASSSVNVCGEGLRRMYNVEEEEESSMVCRSVCARNAYLRGVRSKICMAWSRPREGVNKHVWPTRRYAREAPRNEMASEVCHRGEREESEAYRTPMRFMSERVPTDVPKM